MRFHLHSFDRGLSTSSPQFSLFLFPSHLHDPGLRPPTCIDFVNIDRRWTNGCNLTSSPLFSIILYHPDLRPPTWIGLSTLTSAGLPRSDTLAQRPSATHLLRLPSCPPGLDRLAPSARPRGTRQLAPDVKPRIILKTNKKKKTRACQPVR